MVPAPVEFGAEREDIAALVRHSALRAQRTAHSDEGLSLFCGVGSRGSAIDLVHGSTWFSCAISTAVPLWDSVNGRDGVRLLRRRSDEDITAIVAARGGGWGIQYGVRSDTVVARFRSISLDRIWRRWEKVRCYHATGKAPRCMTEAAGGTD